jgi:hypothetical protein
MLVWRLVLSINVSDVKAISRFFCISWLMTAVKKGSSTILVTVLICLVSLSSVAGKEKQQSDLVGWGLGLGFLFLNRPQLKYEATSIGDIKLQGNSYAGTLFFSFLYKKSLLKQIMLMQGDCGLSWMYTDGHKNMRLEAYPATAESRLNTALMGFGLTLNYLSIRKAWLGSGFELYGGWYREHFDVHVRRDGYDIGIFNPKPRTRTGGTGRVILLSAKILDKFWNSVDLQFGYSWTDISRENLYGRHSLDGREFGTNIDGWYFQIRKLFLLTFKKNRMAESEPRKR